MAQPPSTAFHPYIAPETRMREFTARAVVAGTILGMIFGASSLYLGMSRLASSKTASVRSPPPLSPVSIRCHTA